MQLTITINPGNLSEVRQGIALLNGFLKDAGLTPVETPAATETKPEKVTREKKEKPADTAAASSAPSATSSALVSGTAASEPTTLTTTLEQLSAAVIAVGKAGKRSDLVEYLDTLGVKKASEAPTEKWGDIVAKCNQILAEV